MKSVISPTKIVISRTLPSEMAVLVGSIPGNGRETAEFDRGYSMTVHGLFLRIAIVGVLIGLAPAAVLADSSKVSTVLTNTGIDADAVGTVKLKLKDGKSRMDVKLKSLDAATTYTLFVDGLPWTSFLPPKGNAKLRFSSPVKK